MLVLFRWEMRNVKFEIRKYISFFKNSIQAVFGKNTDFLRFNDNRRLSIRHIVTKKVIER